ncbi:NOL1 NOP2 sun family protein [Babesia ovis]|uniref:NOL1 NOP2 sun family protein n=1 Tax=Babesia ovis TaxID=5869 RepID=A0A9W5TAK7_BABOV|nr:NOL1 NOP2 sun family protein [Babesia ovis]
MVLSGNVAFEAHYAKIYGERWEALSKALRRTAPIVAVIPPFYCHIPDLMEHEQRPAKEVTAVDLEGTAYYRKSDLPFCYHQAIFDASSDSDINLDDIELYDKKAILNANNLVAVVANSIYYMDLGLCYACHALGASPGDRVLDMFAHNGAHSLVFASLMFPCGNTMSGITCEGKSTLEVVALINRAREEMVGKGDKSLLVCAEARRGLYDTCVDNLKKYIPEKLLSSMSIQTLCYDAQNHKLKRFGTFDKIFVRVPTSTDGGSTSQWSQRLVKTNSAKALAALNTAISLLKPGGTIIYVTQSLDPMENELVIHTVLQSASQICHADIDLTKDLEKLRQKISWSSESSTLLPSAEKRRYGCALMPDKTDCGPWYICKLVSNKN